MACTWTSKNILACLKNKFYYLICSGSKHVSWNVFISEMPRKTLARWPVSNLKHKRTCTEKTFFALTFIILCLKRVLFCKLLHLNTPWLKISITLRIYRLHLTFWTTNIYLFFMFNKICMKITRIQIHPFYYMLKGCEIGIHCHPSCTNSILGDMIYSTDSSPNSHWLRIPCSFHSNMGLTCNWKTT